MPRPRFGKLEAQRQEEILAAAAQEFAEHGYSRASMNLIIERAGLSKGAMYYYFDDKQDLFTTVMIRTMERMVSVFGEFPEITSVEQYWGELEAMVHKMFAFAVDDPTLLGLIRSFADAMTSGDISGPLAEMHVQVHNDWNQRWVSLGQSIGAVRTDLPDELLFAMLTALNDAGDVWFAHHFDQIGTPARDALFKKFIQIYRRILEPDPDSPEVFE